ncbi:MAG: glutamate--tRNA ligase [Candidatus Omnitrophica bacterium]|nr:glutamate--tRNA ligase [Candidatus Omnitrophota bacterium]
MVRVRFAPSPTGYLHIGNIRTALFNYLFARKEGGTFILRIEDTDKERCRPEYQEAALEDLSWMEIQWDEGPYEQSKRLDIYQKYISKLIEEGKAYPCYVTEEEIEEIRRIAHLERKPPRFDNRGRFFTKEEIEKRKARGIKPTVRFKIENPQLTMHDLIRGEVSFNLDEMVGDFVIQRSDGIPTFHLAVCVDDGLMEITHVIRGEDHLSNTPKHILLLQAMGFKPPQYGHLSLIHGPGGEPLSKRLESVSVREFRRRGYLPQALANYIALLGWAPGDNCEIFSWDKLQKAFDLKQVNKSASNYDPKKLDWVNSEHIKAMGEQAYLKVACTFLKENNFNIDDTMKLEKALLLFKRDIHTLGELVDVLTFLEAEAEYERKLEEEFKKKTDLYRILTNPSAQRVTASTSSTITLLNSEGEQLYKELVEKVGKDTGMKGKDIFLPWRMSLTRKSHGTELKRIFEILRRKDLQRRFTFVSKLSSGQL